MFPESSILNSQRSLWPLPQENVNPAIASPSELRRITSLGLSNTSPPKVFYHTRFPSRTVLINKASTAPEDRCVSPTIRYPSPAFASAMAFCLSDPPYILFHSKVPPLSILKSQNSSSPSTVELARAVIGGLSDLDLNTRCVCHDEYVSQIVDLD
jgi:hypothetical protein